MDRQFFPWVPLNVYVPLKCLWSSFFECFARRNSSVFKLSKKRFCPVHHVKLVQAHCSEAISLAQAKCRKLFCQVGDGFSYLENCYPLSWWYEDYRNLLCGRRTPHGSFRMKNLWLDQINLFVRQEKLQWSYQSTKCQEGRSICGSMFRWACGPLFCLHGILRYIVVDCCLKTGALQHAPQLHLCLHLPWKKCYARFHSP